VSPTTPTIRKHHEEEEEDAWRTTIIYAFVVTICCCSSLFGDQVFVEFSDTGAAEKAFASLKGRQFASRVVVCTYFSESDFAERKLS